MDCNPARAAVFESSSLSQKPTLAFFGSTERKPVAAVVESSFKFTERNPKPKERWEIRSKNGRRRKKRRSEPASESTAPESGRTSRKTPSSIPSSPLAPILISRSPSLSLSVPFSLYIYISQTVYTYIMYIRKNQELGFYCGFRLCECFRVDLC